MARAKKSNPAIGDAAAELNGITNRIITTCGNVDEQLVRIVMGTIPPQTADGATRSEVLDRVVAALFGPAATQNPKLRAQIGDALATACARCWVDQIDTEVPVPSPAPGTPLWRRIRLYRKTINAPTILDAEQDVQSFKKEQEEMATKKNESTLAPARTAQNDSRVTPGQTIKKSYKGKDYEVRVNQAGFSMDGNQYTSLTAVAKHITGYSAISGHQFFGLWKKQGDVGKGAAATKAEPTAKPKAAAKAKRTTKKVAKPKAKRAARKSKK